MYSTTFVYSSRINIWISPISGDSAELSIYIATVPVLPPILKPIRDKVKHEDYWAIAWPQFSHVTLLDTIMLLDAISLCWLVSFSI